MADGATMPTKRKGKAEKKPDDGKKKQKKSGKPAERAALEPATGKLGDIFEAMRNSSAVSEAMTAEIFDSVLAALGDHCLGFNISATDALPLPKHIRVHLTDRDGSHVSNSDRCIHHQHAFFLGTPVSDELLPEFLRQLVDRCPQLGTVGTWHCEVSRTVPTA